MSDTSDYSLRVTWDQVDHIVTSELRWSYDTMKADLERRREGGGMAIFHTDLEQDVEAIEEHVRALELVLDWFGG